MTYNSMTSTGTGLTRGAAVILDYALDGRALPGWARVVPNQWGGFDITDRSSQIIRVTNDDGQWAVTILADSGVEYGRQTFAGYFALPGIIGAAIQELL
jgi:hypothetical protein